MSRMKKGNGLLRFLISAVFFALVLSGCNGTRKYEAVDLSSETAAAESESGSGEEQERKIPMKLIFRHWAILPGR